VSGWGERNADEKSLLFRFQSAPLHVVEHVN
jgi:hypothetical protein